MQGNTHTCTCDSGWSGPSCDAEFLGFTISGTATDSPHQLSGVYAQTAHVCDGKPVYQKGGRGGLVLFRRSGNPAWLVGPSARATDCRFIEPIYLRSGAPEHCAASPAGADCAGTWKECTSGRNTHTCTLNGAIKVVALHS